MVDYWKIYQLEADRYDRLVSREDQDGNLVTALESICALAGIRIVELGAGTGRITRLLIPHVREILALDLSAPMLEIAHEKVDVDDRFGVSFGRWYFAQADNRQLPVKRGLASLAIAGWSLGHFVGWYKQTWRQEIRSVLSEMDRVIGPDGSLVVIETLGTGRQTPEAPTKGLAEYYRFLEQEHGFSSLWIRTDYRFRSLDEAFELTQFFFGQALAEKVKQAGSLVLPECTGIWFKSPAT